ncbi:MAG TPA: hypothetical protein VMN60_01710 [Longimicrobiales bacterium]|nr:hypothetical protein [Longimicrobiales bacterium]
MMASLALLALAVPVAAQHEGHGGGQFPAGWQGRVDRENQNIADVRLMSMASGLHVITGPHVILWQPQRTGTGWFRASATFTQSKAPERLEGFGILAGGRDLSAATQDYLYFLVRHDGSYLIRHRAGADVHTLQDWTPHAAVVRAGAASSARNTLAIEALPNEVRFVVNDQIVHTIARVPMLRTDGIVGLRVGHHLDVVVSELAVTSISK